MSDLLNFLIENPTDNLSDEVIISSRLSKFPFKIKAMSGPQYHEYQRAVTKVGRKRNVEFNNRLYHELIVLNHTVYPNFRDAESIKKAGCSTPEQFLYRSLLAGEISELANKILELSGVGGSLDEDIEDAKN